MSSTFSFLSRRGTAQRRSSTRALNAVGAMLASIALTGASVVLATPAAEAIPAEGASTSNTPGTSSNVSPSSLKAGDTLSYAVSGFPAGEVVSVKIDDGKGQGDQSTQGAGVSAQQRIDSSGTARGTIKLPANIAKGSHWLRFLASAKAKDGVVGYSNRSANFTVTAAATGGTGAATGGTTGTGTTGTATGGTTGGTMTGGKTNTNATPNRVTAPGAAATGGTAAKPAAGNSSSVAGAAGANTAGGNAQGGSPATVQLADGGTVTGTAGTVDENGNVVDAAGNVLATGAGGDLAAGEQVVVGQDGTTVATTALAANTGARSARFGMYVGGAILIVGLAGVAAYVWLNRRRRYTGSGDDFLYEE